MSDPSAASTRAGSSFTRQLVWPSGQVRLKHGLQESCSETMCALADSGGGNAGLDEPEIAAIGRASAAATGMRPEALGTTREAAEMRAIASSSEGRPATSTPPPPARDRISAG